MRHFGCSHQITVFLGKLLQRGEKLSDIVKEKILQNCLRNEMSNSFSPHYSQGVERKAFIKFFAQP